MSTLATIGIVCVVEAPLMVGLFLLLRLIVRDAIESMRKQIDRVVGLADSADSQYQALRAKVETVERTTAALAPAVLKLEGAVNALKQRVGIPNV